MRNRPLQDAVESGNGQGRLHAHRHSAVSIGLTATLFCQVRLAIMPPLLANEDARSSFLSPMRTIDRVCTPMMGGLGPRNPMTEAFALISSISHACELYTGHKIYDPKVSCFHVAVPDIL
jgi:hypothetical protein